MTTEKPLKPIDAHAESFCIGLLHPFDIRGTKVGGLETYLRDFVTFCPENTRALFVGVDSIGDLELGRIYEISFRGRTFEFMPILYYPDDKAREAARRIRDSITAQFFVAVIRHLPSIARAFRRRRCSIDLRRVEFAWVPFLLRVPFIQMLHGEGVPRLRMDSLLKKYNFIHNLGERFAMATSRKFLCVNPLITERLRRTYPRYKAKIDTLVTWVNTNIFRPEPMPEIGPFRIAFAGRLDAFKVPSLMFKAIARLREKLPGVEFHYISTSDPTRLRQILLNLLSNAIKFGLQQPIRVTAAKTEDGGTEISVIDQGEGVSEDDLTRIFEEFVQVSPTQHIGTGLGLPISRRLATLLDGSLEVKSESGKGSTFTLTLPSEGTAREVDPLDLQMSRGPKKAAEDQAQNEPPKGVQVA